MNLIKTRLIFRAKNYAACIDLYKNIIGLKWRFEKVNGDFKMSEFNFTDSYLFIENSHNGISRKKGIDTNPDGVDLRWWTLKQRLCIYSV